MVADVLRSADEPLFCTLDLAHFWHELAAGTCKVVDSTWTESRCCLLTTTVHGATRAVDARQMRVLRAVLLAGAQKVVAIDSGRAASTIAFDSSRALRALGMQPKVSRVHPLLILAARAAQLGAGSEQAQLNFIASGDRDLRLVSIRRPELWLAGKLSDAEYDVTRHLVEGCSSAEIARRRAASQRTVANQLGSVFRKLRVSGRGELLHLLFSQRAQIRALPKAGKHAARARFGVVREQQSSFADSAAGLDASFSA